MPFSFRAWISAAGLAAASASPAFPATFGLVVEADVDVGAPLEVTTLSYGGFGDVLSNSGAGFDASQLDLISDVSIVGAAYDGRYRLLIESDVNVGAPLEVTALTYDSFGDLVGNTGAVFDASQLDLISDVSIVGLAYDGRYRLLLETDVDVGPPLEVTMLTYDTWSDLLNNTWSEFDASQFDVGPDYSIAGLAYDGQYRVLLESDANAPAGVEFFGLTFPTWQDLVLGVPSGASFSQLNLVSDLSVRGMFYADDGKLGPVTPVPLPVPAMLLAAGLVALAGGARRRPADRR